MKNRMAMYEISTKFVFRFFMLCNMVFEQELLPLTPKGGKTNFVLIFLSGKN